MYGFSVPRMLGVTGRPTRVGDMILPPVAHDVKVISVGMFVEGNVPVVWRGPMLHRALQQFLADVFWGDLDVLLLDLPPGTGDIAISTAQLVPTAELLVVTTPQTAAAEVAERAGAIALQTRQRLAGVVENMSPLRLPDGTMLDLFGSGGGAAVAASLTRLIGAAVPLLGQVPLEVAPARGWRRRHAAGAGRPRQPGRRGAAGGGRRACRAEPPSRRRVARHLARRPLTRVRFRRGRTAAGIRGRPRPASARAAAAVVGISSTIDTGAGDEPFGGAAGAVAASDAPAVVPAASAPEPRLTRRRPVQAEETADPAGELVPEERCAR